MSKGISRRDFIKLGGLAVGGLAYNSFPAPQEEYGSSLDEIGRVTIKSISVFAEPNVDAETVAYRFIDELLNLYYPLTPISGPSYNPLWYRVWGGYVHSAYIQRTKVQLNPVLNSLPESGHQLCEVTVPYTQIYFFGRDKTWERKNRLYYTTTHWAVGIDEGPDGKAWYRLYDELLETEYHVPASHLRPVPDDEMAPISPNVPPHRKRIEVSLQRQVLTAFEEDEPVFQTQVSSGIPSGKNPPEGTNTPKGEWNVYSKMPTKHMGDGLLTGAPDVYTLPGVPWTVFFHDSGVAFHGAYWHDNFGNPMSHGCVNMRPEDAKWLFRWTTPLWPPPEGDRRFWERTGHGTKVVVI